MSNRNLNLDVKCQKISVSKLFSLLSSEKLIVPSSVKPNVHRGTTVIESLLLRLNQAKLVFSYTEEGLYLLESGSAYLLDLYNFVQGFYTPCNYVYTTELNNLPFKDFEPYLKRRILETDIDILFIYPSCSSKDIREIIKMVRVR